MNNIYIHLISLNLFLFFHAWYAWNKIYIYIYFLKKKLISEKNLYLKKLISEKNLYLKKTYIWKKIYIWKKTYI